MKWIVNDWKWLLQPISEKSRLIREKGKQEDAKRAGVNYEQRKQAKTNKRKTI